MYSENIVPKTRHIIKVYCGTSEKQMEAAGFKGLRILKQLHSGTVYWCDKLGDEQNSDNLHYEVVV